MVPTTPPTTSVAEHTKPHTGCPFPGPHPVWDTRSAEGVVPSMAIMGSPARRGSLCRLALSTLFCHDLRSGRRVQEMGGGGRLS